jgi:hypothetical protein
LGVRGIVVTKIAAPLAIVEDQVRDQHRREAQGVGVE